MKRLHILILMVCCMLSMVGNAQKKRTVLLEQCEELTFDKQGGRSYQVLRGNVRFRHEDVLMYCDSAYFYDGGTNSFDAFGHVRVIQTTETSMTADSLFYDGTTTLMRVRGQVALRSGTSTLNTHFLDFYRDKNYGYYYGGGEVVDQSYHLTSYQGYYYADAKSYLFKDTVVLTHPDYTIYADSLRYNQPNSKATLLGPSLVKGQKYKVHTTKGWIYTTTNEGKLFNRSVINYEKGKRMTADSIYFNAQKGWVKAYGKAEAQDSIQKIIVRGEYMEGDSVSPAFGKVMGNPYIVEYSDNDSLYLKGDLLYFTQKDSTFRVYHNVWFYRSDMQGKCDSLVYYSKDSMAVMFRDPIIWAEKNQLTGATNIEIYIKNQEPDHIHIPEKALIIQDEDGGKFNQLCSKKADAYLENSKLRRVDMVGEATSLYYTRDDAGLLVGMNKANGPEMSIFTKNNKLDKIIMTPESEGTMFPPDKIPEEELYLKGFKWRDDDRPKTKEEFFRK